MPITTQQTQQADARQTAAAQDAAGVTRTLAGPGTGKSRCIEKRIDWLLQTGIDPSNIFVISFTRASSRDLQRRIVNYCTGTGMTPAVNLVKVSTMHSLALSALRNGNLLTGFAAGPIILDEWEQQHIFDLEYAEKFSVTPTRAKEVRNAYDAYWQTLQATNLASVSHAEQQNFTAYYSEMSSLYSCILPGEVVRRCVDAMRSNILSPTSLLGISHLVVDEFQDLNKCDQEFIEGITRAGATLWVAGDDDQSIYSFRHADPSGIQNFPTTYNPSSSHALPDCFRCTPQVLAAATRLITHNPSPPRIQKGLVSLYASASPPVQGSIDLWRFSNGALEARAIAESVRDLIRGGLHGRDILVLLSNRRAQMPMIEQAFRALNIDYAAPRGPALADTTMGRLVLSLLRILRDPDHYAAHRDLLGISHGVGIGTCISIGAAVTAANLNFKDLFYAPFPTQGFNQRALRAIDRVGQVCRVLRSWGIIDTLADHDQALVMMIGFLLDPMRAGCQQALQEWNDLRASLPDGMTLEELLAYLEADTEVSQLAILQESQDRLGVPPTAAASITERVRILTMHGAKGLEGKVVFIPGLEQELTPGRYAAASPGQVQERRRLLYVSITRAQACCILSFAQRRSGAQAQTLVGRSVLNPAPSQFIAELSVAASNRASGFTATETQAVLSDCANL